MNVSEYARHRGVSRQAIYGALKAGRITRGEDGKIDSELADAQWAETTNPIIRGENRKNADNPKPKLDPNHFQETLVQCCVKLSAAIELVPELEPLEGFINGQTQDLYIAFRDLYNREWGQLTPADAHFTLFSLAKQYLIDSGQVSAEDVDSTEQVYWDVLSNSK